MAGQKRKRSAIVTVTSENGKKKRIVDETVFHPELQKAITEVKGLITQGEHFSPLITLLFLSMMLTDAVVAKQNHGNIKENSLRYSSRLLLN